AGQSASESEPPAAYFQCTPAAFNSRTGRNDVDPKRGSAPRRERTCTENRPGLVSFTGPRAARNELSTGRRSCFSRLRTPLPLGSPLLPQPVQQLRPIALHLANALHLRFHPFGQMPAAGGVVLHAGRRRFSLRLIAQL